MNAKLRRFSEFFYNPITYVGVLIAVLVFFLEIFLFAMDFFAHGTNIYLELVTYLILPGFLFFGLFLIPIGYLWQKRRAAAGRAFNWQEFRIDLAIPYHRNALLVFLTGSSILGLMSMVGAYQAFHYTESVEFCGTLCHSVMKPEHTTYGHSPHGRVACVDCHIGAGADWYVRSKASGLRQVYRTLLNSYDRPIATPIHNLRPAEETCKQCHWPGKFFSTLDFHRAYFLKEEDNPRWNMRMLLNVGSGEHQIRGVHAHMNLESEIFYAAEDERRQNISWVKSVDRSGRETVYLAPNSKFKAAGPDASAVRHMDCIDCHNRPTHQFQPPFRLMNAALSDGDIDPGIPSIKEQGVEVLAAQYPTTEAALDKIRQTLTSYYQKDQADYYETNKERIEHAIVKIQDMFDSNFFPEMKARWDVYPDNIGHLYSPGCFRCHDGRHHSPDGRTITNDCKSCHVIVQQGPAGKEQKSLDGLEFKHPGGGSEWKETLCTECHTGGSD